MNNSDNIVVVQAIQAEYIPPSPVDRKLKDDYDVDGAIHILATIFTLMSCWMLEAGKMWTGRLKGKKK